jgi:peptidoglycan-N-acetylglucosamine deacetylase
MRSPTTTRPPSTPPNRTAYLLGGATVLLFILVSLAGCDAGSGGSGDRVKLVITPVDTPTATPLTAPTVAPTTYVVKSGDTLSGIAALFGVTVDDIVRANNIADPSRISEGQELTIPARAGGSATETPSGAPGTSTANPAASPTLPPPDVTPPLGPGETEPGGASSPGPSISPTVAP